MLFNDDFASTGRDLLGEKIDYDVDYGDLGLSSDRPSIPQNPNLGGGGDFGLLGVAVAGVAVWAICKGVAWAWRKISD